MFESSDLLHASPYQVLLSALNTRLSGESSSTFAGTTRASDGGINLYVTAADARLREVVQQLSAQAGGQVSVKIIEGAANSLSTLKQVQGQILARHQELVSRGIRIVEFGVDVTRNRVRVGVKGLTPAAAAYLTAEFASDLIYVFEGGEYSSVASQGC